MNEFVLMESRPHRQMVEMGTWPNIAMMIRTLLPLLSNAERTEVARLFGEWCQHCGDEAPCQCWNDE